MVILGSTIEEINESQERARKLQFFGEIIADINELFVNNNIKEISALKTFLNDEELFTKLEEACVGAVYPEEKVLFIQEGRFYIYGDEFTEDEISKIVSAYIEDDDIKGYIDIVDSFSYVEDDESDFSFGMALANFPGNIIGKVVEKIRKTPFCKSIRDRVDKINGM